MEKMEKRIITMDSLKKLPKLSRAYNSRLYLDGNSLIKYLSNPVFDDSWEKREKKLELLERIIEPEYILPEYLLYLNSVITSNLRAYGMKYFMDYKDISRVIEDDNYSHKDRLEICKKICDMFVNLEKYKIAYWDVHGENILIKDKDIKLCDMDAATSKLIDGDYAYRSDLADSYRYLTLMVLSILYGIDDQDLSKSLERKKSRKFVKDSKMFSRVVNPEGYIFYPNEYLDMFTEDYVEGTRRLLLK